MVKLIVNNNVVELSSINDAIYPLVILRKIYNKTPSFDLMTSDGRPHPKKSDLEKIVENHFFNKINSVEISKLVDEMSPYSLLSDKKNLLEFIPINNEKESEETIQTLYMLGY